jgi:hypothetical protein
VPDALSMDEVRERLRQYQATARDLSKDVAQEGPVFEFLDDLAVVSDEFERAFLYERFSPLGDNHHNAAACPHCGDLLGKVEDAYARVCERAATLLTKLRPWQSYAAEVRTASADLTLALAAVPDVRELLRG